MTPPAVPAVTLADIQAERDFLLCLVELLDHQTPNELVERALALLAARAGAERAYLEIGDTRSPTTGWWASAGFADRAIEAVRGVLSTTIIAHTLASGRSIETASAAGDDRFGEASSVRRNRIEAVLCVPIGTPAVGAIYLQGHPGGQRFPSIAKAWVERFAAHLSPIARRLVMLQHVDDADPTLPQRARLADTEGIVGRSAALATALRLAASVAPLHVPLLLTGPSGTGKSELARIIAGAGPRRQKPFIAINCAAIPDELLESELFGAHAGAHSTATRKIVGKVELADQGTLFLDEIADLSLPAQAKLLQFIQEGSFWPLGSAKAMQVDVRVIAATNANLTQRVTEGRFREDLYYRLNVMSIAVPGLDARRTDIPLLASHFLREARERHGITGLELSLAARHALMVSDWPGNIRQLANTVLGAAIRAHSEGAPAIEAHHCFPESASPEKRIPPWSVAMRETQRRLLRDALEECNGNVAEAGRRLGIARSYVYELVKELGLRS